MQSTLRSLAVAIALALGLAAAPSRADFAYGVTLVNNQLITVDTTTGLGSLVGPLDGTVSPFGLASTAAGLFTYDSNASVLRQINAATGGTVATYDVGIGPVAGQGGLAFQGSTIGYLSTALDPTTFDTVNDLYRFNLTTRTSTLLTHTADTLGALAVSGTGALFGLGKLSGNLYGIDTTTGAMTLVGNTGVFIGAPTESLAFSSGGMLFATLNDTLYTLNTLTGAATQVGSDPTAMVGYSSISGLAFSGTVSGVPEPGSIGLMGLGLTAVAIAARRRRRAGAG